MGWKKKLGIGCGIFALLSCVGCIGLGLLLKGPATSIKEMEEAKNNLQQKVFDAPDLETIAVDDLDRFLPVLESLGERFNEFDAAIKELQEKEDRGEDPSVKDAMRVVGDVIGRIKGMIEDLDKANMGFEEFDFYTRLTIDSLDVLEDQAFWQAPEQQEAEELRNQLKELELVDQDLAADEINEILLRLEGPRKHSDVPPLILDWVEAHSESFNSFDLNQLRHMVRGFDD